MDSHDNTALDRVDKSSTSLKRNPVAEHLARDIYVPGIICVLLAILLYLPTSKVYLDSWTYLNGNYGHGFLIMLLVIYAFWHKRHKLFLVRVQSWPLGVPILLCLSLAWAIAHLVNVKIIEVLTLALIIPALLVVIYGAGFLRVACFPLAFIWLAVPIWDILMPYLQGLTANASFTILELMGVPVYRDGNAIYIPSGQFEIAEYCSGLRYLLSALSISIFYAWWQIYDVWKRIMFVLFVGIVAIIANWIRVVAVIMVGHVTAMQSPLVSDHATMGWVLFMIIMLPVFYAGHRIAMANDIDTGNSAVPNGTTPDKAIGNSGKIEGIRREVKIGTIVLSLVVLSAGPVLSIVYSLDMEDSLSENDARSIVMPERIGSWSKTKHALARWAPVFQGASRIDQFWYRNGQDEIGLTIAHYSRQRPGREAVTSLNRVYDPLYWRLEDHRRIRAASGSPRLDILQSIVRSADGRQRCIWTWYDIAGHVTASDIMAKLYEIEGVVNRRYGAAVIAIMTDGKSVGEMKDRLNEFYMDSFDVINNEIGSSWN